MTSKRNLLLPALLIVGLFSKNYPAQIASAAPAKKLTATKSYQVTINSKDSGMKASQGGSFEVGSNAKPTIKIDWNKWGFLIKDDAGKTIGGISDDVAFGKKQTARFVMQKIVCVTQSNGSVTADTSTKTVAVRRGVVATF